LKEEAVAYSLLKTHFGNGYGPVVRLQDDDDDGGGDDLQISDMDPSLLVSVLRY
jgi:hypothetical protein